MTIKQIADVAGVSIDTVTRKVKEMYPDYVIEYLKNVYGMGARLEEIKQVASTTSSWKEFTQYFSEVYE